MGDWGWSRLGAAEKQAILRGLAGGEACGPFHVELQPSDRCALDCSFCSTRHRRKDDELPVEKLPGLLRQLKAMDTKAITLCGGGEPLGYRHLDRLLCLLADLDLPIEHVTTNGVHLTPQRSRTLRNLGLRHVIVSLNAPDAASYAKLMRVPEAVFNTVVANIRALLAERGLSSRPEIVVQFVIYRGSHLDIPRMYDLALRLGVDKILFTELAFLPPALRLGPGETAAMTALFADIVARDGFRLIGAINSFDRNLDQELAVVRNAGLRRSFLAKAIHLARGSGTARQKARHYLAHRRRRRSARIRESHDGACVAPWYSLVVLADGSVPVCPVLQDKRLANVLERPVKDVWNGAELERLRRQVRHMVSEGDRFRRDPDDLVESMCSWWSPRGCTFREFYYCLDVPFVRQLHRTIDELRSLRPAGTAAATAPVA